MSRSVSQPARSCGLREETDDWRVQLSEPKRRRLRIWFWTIAAVTLAIVALGGITRLTQSGLSIVDWQPLIGTIPPMNEAQWVEAFDRYRQFPEYRQLRRAMTLDDFKVIFFWEYLHRLVARLIGALFLIPFAFFWRAGYLPRPLVWRALGLFGLGAMQGVMGWVMVSSGLIDRPSVSHYRLAAHLALAFIILGYSVWLARNLGVHRHVMTPDARRVVTRGLATVGSLLAAQIVWGAFVAGLRAGLVFNTFPLMGGQLLPPSGLALHPPLLNFVQNMVTVQWTHRLLGTVVLICSLMFYVRVRRIAVNRSTRRLNRVLLLLIASQYLLGVLTLIFRVPTAVAVPHQVMAGVIVAVWVIWMHDAARRPRD